MRRRPRGRRTKGGSHPFPRPHRGQEPAKHPGVRACRGNGWGRILSNGCSIPILAFFWLFPLRIPAPCCCGSLTLGVPLSEGPSGLNLKADRLRLMFESELFEPMNAILRCTGPNAATVPGRPRHLGGRTPPSASQGPDALAGSSSNFCISLTARPCSSWGARSPTISSSPCPMARFLAGRTILFLGNRKAIRIGGGSFPRRKTMRFDLVGEAPNDQISPAEEAILDSVFREFGWMDKMGSAQLHPQISGVP